LPRLRGRQAVDEMKMRAIVGGIAALSLGCWRAGRLAHVTHNGNKPVVPTQTIPITPRFVMEVLLIVSSFVALAVLAARFGYDSREQLLSIEESFAKQGFAWRGNPR